MNLTARSRQYLFLGKCCFVRKNFFRLKSLEADFQRSVEKIKELSKEPDIATKLKLYGLYKQAMNGDVVGKRPFMLSPSQAKYDAWKEYIGISKDKARKMYIDLANSLSMAEEKTISPGGTATLAPDGLKPVPGLDVTFEDKVLWIRLNRPNKYNALSWEMYDGIVKALDYGNESADITVTALTGTGQYFCSGNDLANFTKVKSPADVPRMATEAGHVLSAYVAAYINHRKALIALVNGPAIGIAVTVLPLFDLVIASDKATFSTPFTSLGQSPEGCSTYTFPILMGNSKASEMLIFERKLTAHEALERNLITRVVPSLRFREEAKNSVRTIARLPPESLRCNKAIVRDVHRQALLAQSEREITLLVQRWQSTECLNAIQRFMTRKQSGTT